MHEHCSIHSSRNSRQWAGSNDFNTVEQNQRYEPVYLPQFHIPDDPTIDFAKCPTMRPIYLLVFIPPLSMELAERTGFQYSTYRLTMTIDPSPSRILRPTQGDICTSREPEPEAFERTEGIKMRRKTRTMTQRSPKSLSCSRI